MPQFDPQKYAYPSRRNVVYARRAMACTSVPLGAQIGLDVMKAGGNAVDAAVGLGAALPRLAPPGPGRGARVRPRAAGRGGRPSRAAARPPPRRPLVRATGRLVCAIILPQIPPFCNQKGKPPAVEIGRGLGTRTVAALWSRAGKKKIISSSERSRRRRCRRRRPERPQRLRCHSRRSQGSGRRSCRRCRRNRCRCRKKSRSAPYRSR